MVRACARTLASQLLKSATARASSAADSCATRSRRNVPRAPSCSPLLPAAAAAAVAPTAGPFVAAAGAAGRSGGDSGVAAADAAGAAATAPRRSAAWSRCIASRVLYALYSCLLSICLAARAHSCSTCNALLTACGCRLPGEVGGEQTHTLVGGLPEVPPSLQLPTLCAQSTACAALLHPPAEPLPHPAAAPQPPALPPAAVQTTTPLPAIGPHGVGGCGCWTQAEGSPHAATAKRSS